MLLDSLRVHAFRGITNELPLDLRARLTLIHAPNGVGKTSLCDALEWLFTGEVERLKEPLGKSKGKGVSNIFTSTQPSVEAEIRNGGGPSRIRRDSETQANQIKVFEGGTLKKVLLNKLLANITPENLPQSSKGLQRLNNRRSWFRAVRLLEAHALDLLLDTDDSSNEVRDLVFCDLLGVGELQRQERDLMRIVGAIGGKARLKEDVLRVKREIGSRESEITAEALYASAPSLETYQQQISAVSRRLGVQALAKAGPPESHLAAAENAYKLVDRKLGQQRSALIYVRTKATSYSALGEEITLLGKQQERSSLRRAEVQKELEIATSLVQRLENDASQAEALERSLISQPVDSVRAALELTLAQWRELTGDAQTQIDLTELQAAVTAARANQSRATGLLETVLKCEDSLKLWREAKVREETTGERIRNIKLPTSEDRDRVEQSLSGTRSTLATIETQINQLAGPLEQLRIGGRDFLDGTKDEQRCPLCAHDHGNPSNLRKAIESGISKIPESLDALAVQKQLLEVDILSFEQRAKIWNEAAETLESLTAEREEARRLLTEAKPTLETLGIDPKELRDDSLAGRIAGLRSKTEGQVTEAERLAEERARRFEIALELQSVAREILSLSENVRALSDSAPIADLEHLPPDNWTRVLELIIKNAETTAAKARVEAAHSRKNAEEARVALAGLRGNLQTLTTSITEISEKIGIAKSGREEFETQWRLVADDESWDYQLLGQRQVILDEGEENLSQAKQEIESARGALVAAREAESNERDRASGQRQLTELKARLHELERIEEVRSQCVVGADALRTAKDAFVKKQIQPLCDVITALYVRAQSATFIDRIDSSQDEGPLRWLACIGEHQLEDTAQMSLGQRQDLALAIFLSRARELGGTFFLDEPLLNLDDLNRIAVLDVLRTIVIEQRSHPVRLVVTTANHSLVRHCKEKFALVKGSHEEPSLRAYSLAGDPQSGVSAVVDN
jgi:DNA repair exonuclease SbcCD ATPase subunit